MRSHFWFLPLFPLLLDCESAPLPEDAKRDAVLLQPCAPLDEFVQLPACSDASQCSWYLFQPANPNDASAELQAALDTVLARAATQPVLFIPKGTYTLRATVRLLNAVGISIVGEDPEQTVLRWAGPPNTQMFVFDGVSNIKVSRLSLLGSGSGVGIQQVRSRCPELAPGVPNDKTLIRRCLFDQTARGIAISGFNALGWDVWDSTFRGNQYGITVTQATANSWRNSFQASTAADHLYAGAAYAELRENRSNNSASFFAGSSTYGAQLIDNVVFTEPPQRQSAAVFGTVNQLLLLRNQIATPAPMPAVYVDSQWSTARYVATHGDNKISGPLSTFLKTSACCSATVTSLDLADLGQQPISPPGISDPVHPPKSNRPMPPIEINPTWTADAINMKLGAAPQNAVVHFRAATYVLNKTLQVSGAKNLAIIGDGIHSRLVAQRGHVPPGEPVFDVSAPAQGGIRDLRIGQDAGIPFYASTGVRVHTTVDSNGFVYVDTPILDTVKTCGRCWLLP